MRSPWQERIYPSTMSRALAVYAVLALVICFFRLGDSPVLLTEGMVAEAGRNMLESGDWVVPHMYGEPYTYKPPMAYWAAAWSFAVSDGRPSELLLRLPFAAAAWLMGMAIVVLIGRRSDPFAGLLAGLGTLGGAAFVQKSQSANFDVLVAAGIGVAVAASCVNLTAERGRPALWLLAYLGLTFAFLTKGLLALMVFGPGLIVAAWVAGRMRRLFEPSHLLASGLFAAVVIGYVVLLGRALGAEGFDQPLAEAQRRALTWTLEDLRLTIAKPFLIWGGLLPWSLLLLPAVKMARMAPEAEPRVRLLRASLAFLVTGVVAFMLVPTHNMRYYLPLAAPAGIAAGVTASLLKDRGAAVLLIWASRLPAIALGIASLALATFGDRLGVGDHLDVLERLLLAATFLMVVVVLWKARRLPGGPVPALLLAGTLAFVVYEGVVLEPERASKRALDDLALQLEPLVPAGETLWVRGPADFSGKHSSLFFYLDRPARAFKDADQVPVGGYYIFAEELYPEASQTDMEFEVIEVFDHPHYMYKLARHLGSTP